MWPATTPRGEKNTAFLVWIAAGPLWPLQAFFLRLYFESAAVLSLEHPCLLPGRGAPKKWSPPSPCSSLLTLFFSGLIPHLLGDVVFLWGCNLLAHFINAYLVDDSVSDTPGGLGNDQNPGSQVGWNKDLSIFPCTADTQGLGQTQDPGILSTRP